MSAISRNYGFMGQSKTWPRIVIYLIIGLILMIEFIFIKNLYLHVLIYLVEQRQTDFFHYLSCKKWELTEFKK